MRHMAIAGLRLLACVSAFGVCVAAADAAGVDPLAPAAKAAPAPVPATAPLLRPGQPIPAEALAAYIDGVMEARMKSDHIAGVAVSIVQDGKVALKRGYGVSAVGPDRPVDPDRTLFRLGSVSKLFIWTALTQDIEAGRIDPAKPVDAYLPERLWLKTAWPRAITFGQLMSHSAGLEDRALGHLGADDPAKVMSLDDFLLTARPLQVRPPGHASYSNYGADLAGWIVAHQEGTDFETLVERRIAGPLGLAHTTFREPRPARAGLPAPMAPALAADLSKGFRWRKGAFEPQKTELLGGTAPAGSVSSTAADMAKVMQAMLGGGEVDGARLYGPKAAALLRTPVLAMPVGMNGWAHGLMITYPGGKAAYGHYGDTFMFHAGLMTVPELNLGVFVATNTENGNALATALPTLVIEHFYGRTPIGAAFRAPRAGEMKAYEGTYLNTRRGFTAMEKFLGLTQGGGIAATGKGLMVDNGSGSRPYLPTTEPGVFRTADRTGVISFDLEGGRPVRWRTAANSGQWEKARLWEEPTTLAVAAGLGLLAAIATIVGLCTRRRPYPQTGGQRLASRVQTAAAAAWLVSALALAVWSPVAGDHLAMVLGWPQPMILVFGWAAVLAAILSAVGAALLVPAWSGHGERAWSLWRKLRYSTTVVVFLGLALVLALRGGLQPWII